jgi:general secretion pathway protein A
MDLGAAGLSEQPFPTHGRPLSTLSYASYQQALKILEETCTKPNGLSLLQGPTLSGKSTIIRNFVKSLPEESSFAVVDGNGLNTTGLLEAILRQFGYEFDHNSPNELLAMLRVFAMQQAASHEPPLLVIENVHALNPSALRTLCELATLKVRNTSALKMVLVSDRPLRSIIDAPALDCISKRLLHDFHLRPMSSDEAMHYVHEKLRAAGSLVPEFVFPISVCTELWRCSGGWPGIVDRIALLALAKSDTLPVPMEEIEHPALPNGTWYETEMVAAGQYSSADPNTTILQSTANLSAATIRFLYAMAARHFLWI